jgi:hypothetical protein
MIFLTPVPLLATDPGAMLRGQGPVWLNGKLLPESSAIFPGDLIQTQPESVATVEASGSSVIVMPNSLVKFAGNAVSLEHGVLSVATSQELVAQTGEVVATPASNKWTEFELSDANGVIQVIARKGELNVNCGKNSTKLSDGEQVSPDDSGRCKKRRTPDGSPPGAHNSILHDPYVQGGELAGGGGIVCLLLCFSSKPFVSQWKP